MTQIEKTNEDQSYCTRFSDGVSGMSVTALAQFCGAEQHTITQTLNRLRFLVIPRRLSINFETGQTVFTLGCSQT